MDAGSGASKVDVRGIQRSEGLGEKQGPRMVDVKKKVEGCRLTAASLVVGPGN